MYDCFGLEVMFVAKIVNIRSGSNLVDVLKLC